MRGEHLGATFLLAWPMRIIPACAGSTSGMASCIWRVTGSSPHARGALGVVRHVDNCHGIIPACAGST